MSADGPAIFADADYCGPLIAVQWLANFDLFLSNATLARAVTYLAPPVHYSECLTKQSSSNCCRPRRAAVPLRLYLEIAALRRRGIYAWVSTFWQYA